jgi:hypothetical protein
MNSIKNALLIIIVITIAFILFFHYRNFKQPVVENLQQTAPIENKNITESGLASSVDKNSGVIILSETKDTLDLLNSSGKDIKFKMATFGSSAEVIVPQGTKFSVMGFKYTGEQRDKTKTGWFYVELTEEMPNGLSIEFRDGVDGPWDECSYENDNCNIEKFRIGNVDLESWTSKESGKLLSVSTDGSMDGIEGVRIYTKNGRPLDDADKVNIAKVLSNMATTPYK